MAATQRKYRIGASELALVSGNVTPDVTALNWWKTFTKIYVRSFGYEDFMHLIGVDPELIISMSSSEEESQIVIDERKVKQDVETLKQSKAYKEMTTTGVATSAFYDVVDEIKADQRAVGIVVEESRVKAGILKKNNNRCYGKDYVHPSAKKEPVFVHLSAYVDGENEDGSLVEEKTRKYRAVYEKSVPLYKRIQMAVILYVTERETIHYVQHFCEDTRTETFSRSELVPQLARMMKPFIEMLKRTDFADKFRTELTLTEKNDIVTYAGTLMAPLR